ncbi:MAG: iron-sulfur cluster assembly scaffold protein [Candidatus Tectomicrobia bacterium]|nr:iron-sulfur cluster assembly scaffold protein [Candidatus Tectomicrobia bacterium]
MLTDEVLYHFKNPQHQGSIEDAEIVASVVNPACGDTLKVYVKLDGDRITDAKYKIYGCAAAVAASSVVTGMLIGKTLSEIESIKREQVSDALGGLSPTHAHTAVLAEDAVKAILRTQREKS